MALQALAVALIGLLSVSGVQGAALLLNNGSPVLEPTPSLVNSAATIAIESLMLDTGELFVAGDCFQMEFDNIDSYDAKKPGHYKVIPDSTIAVCSLAPAATCEKLSDSIIKFTLTEEGAMISGELGKIMNPYSRVDLKLREIRYYDGCTSDTQAASTTGIASTQNGVQLILNPGDIPTVDFSTAVKVTGDHSFDNIATFTFTPNSQLSTLGGYIDITAPGWYTSTRRTAYAYEETNFECLSDRFVSILSQKKVTAYVVGTGLRSSYKINYSALYGAATDPITITCRYWRNPIIPAVDTGYVIQTLDYDSNLMDVSAEFSLDATAYTPYQVLDSDVAY